MATDVIDQFVDSWGTMGSFWGVNTSVARVHGLLIASDRPWCLDEISERLNISRSNVSVCLKDLRSWGVVRKVIQRGDRREFYTCEPDVWKMLFSIMRERKKREFDPTLSGVRLALASAKERPGGVAVDRLKQMDKMLTAFERLADRLLAGEPQARVLLSLLTDRG